MRIVIAAATATLLATGAQAVTIVNGGFELGTNPGATFTTEAAGSTDITGWTVGLGGVDYIGGFWQPSEGARSIDLTAIAAGSLSQTLTGLTVNAVYRVTFDLSANPSGGSSTKTVNVAVGGTPTAFTYTRPAGQSRTNMLWAAQTYLFTATGTSQALSFTSLDGSASGPALDNVAITRVGAIPEPAAWALMIAGFGMVGYAARRRRNAAVTA